MSDQQNINLNFKSSNTEKYNNPLAATPAKFLRPDGQSRLCAHSDISDKGEVSFAL